MPSSVESAQLVVDTAVTELQCELPVSLARYLAEVFEWNSVLSLVSRKEPIAACERLLLESIELGRLLQVDGLLRVADVGSGAGFPGMVWALLYPRVELVLIERRERRALFLERTARTLDLTNVTVVADDLAHVSRETLNHSGLDLVVSIAVGEPSRLAAAAERLLTEDGSFATTVPRETLATSSIGTSLRLLRKVEGKFGCYVIYQRGV